MNVRAAAFLVLTIHDLLNRGGKNRLEEVRWRVRGRERVTEIHLTGAYSYTFMLFSICATFMGSI